MDDSKKLSLNKKLADFCKKNGITCLKTADFEVHFSPLALLPEKKKASKEDPPADFIPIESQYTDDQILFWSAENIPQESQQGVQ